jgi:hypothetical protein
MRALDYDDFKIMTFGSNTKVLVLRRWNGALRTFWCAFFEHEKNELCAYDNQCKTPEEAISKFIKYRIEGYSDAVTLNYVSSVSYHV